MTALGIGTRVWVGWCDQEDLVGEYAGSARLRQGTVVDGPFAPGSGGWCIRTTFWLVDLDGGRRVAASESLLTPIDDDSETEREAVEEVAQV